MNANYLRLHRWLLPALLDWAVIFIALYAAWRCPHWLMYLPVLFVVGSRQHALSILGHDGAHYLICRSRRLNDWLTCLLCFWPLCVGLTAYRAYHFQHHRSVGTYDDPEWQHYADWNVDRRNEPPACLKATIVFMDCLGLGFPEVFRLMLSIGRRGYWDWIGPTLWLAVPAAMLWCGVWQPVAIWYAAIFTTFWATFRLRIWTEHVGAWPALTKQYRPRWWERLWYLPHNTWLHWEHHARPQVPFWALGQHS